MADAVKNSGKKLRPHAKAHKCVEIAKRQIAAGACGICVATVAEAELMSKAGFTGLLLTSPLADPRKIGRIVGTGAMVVVDHVQQVEWYEAAAGDGKRTIDVLIDLDVGDHRTGASSPEQALEIARAVDRAPHLQLRGLQGYSVSGSHASGTGARTRISEHGVSNRLRDSRRGRARRPAHGNPFRRQHGHLGHRSRAAGADGTASRLVCADGSRLPPAGADFGPALTVLATCQRQS